MLDSRSEQERNESRTTISEIVYARSIDEPKPFDPWHVYTAEDAFIDTGEPPWVINNLLMEHSATIVSAQPKAMKSLSLLQAAMEAPLTGKVWGRFEAPDVKRTLFIETEDPLHLVKARIRGLYKGLGVKSADELEGFHFVRVGPFRLLDEANKLSELLDSYAPDFAVISTLQNILGERDWNSQQNMQPIMEIIIKLAEKCPLFLVTHSPQNKKQKRPAGTITQAANFAAALHYEKKVSNGETTVQVTADSKAGGLPTFSMKLVTDGPPGDPESVRKLIAEGAWKQSARQIIRTAVADNPKVSCQDLMDLTGTGKRNVQKVLKELREKKRAA